VISLTSPVLGPWRQCSPVRITSALQLSADFLGTPKKPFPFQSSAVCTHSGQQNVEKHWQEHTTFVTLPDPNIHPMTCCKVGSRNLCSHTINKVIFCLKATGVHGILHRICEISAHRRQIRPRTPGRMTMFIKIPEWQAQNNVCSAPGSHINDLIGLVVTIE